MKNINKKSKRKSRRYESNNQQNELNIDKQISSNCIKKDISEHDTSSITLDVLVNRIFTSSSLSIARENILFLSPLTMRNFDLSISEYVLVSSKKIAQNNRTIARIWPLSSILPGQVGVFLKSTLFFISVNETLKIHKLFNPIIIAEKIILRLITSQPPKLSQNILKGYLLKSLIGHLVMNEMDFSFDIPGISDFAFQIIGIDPIFNNTEIDLKENISEIDLSLKNLSIDNEIGKKQIPSATNTQLQDINNSTTETFHQLFTQNGNIYRVTTNINIEIVNNQPSYRHNSCFNNTLTSKSDLFFDFSSVGGLNKEISMIRELIELPLFLPESFSRYGLKPPTGVLLYGSSGTGKSLIARCLSTHPVINYVSINGPEIVSQYVGESEQTLRHAFSKAIDNSPSIIFIDEIDIICGKRDTSTDELSKRLVSSLLTCLDSLHSNIHPMRVVVVAATNRIDALDPAVRRPGRFDKEIEIGIPSESKRVDIITVMIRFFTHTLSPSDIRDVASRTLGFVGADLSALCSEAVLSSIRNNNKENINNSVNLNDFLSSLNIIRPSALREIQIEVPRVKWCDVGGQEDVKQRLKETVELPLLYPDAFLRMGISPPKGILLYGPPGCSKTLMARALATESRMNFISVKGPELFSKWVGSSERAIREIFRKARAASPSIIFFDEIDSIAVSRSGAENDTVTSRVLSQLLLEMDGLIPLRNVVVIAATNRPDVLDSALLRPGRFDRMLFIKPPDYQSRKAIFHIQFRNIPVYSDVNIDTLAKKSVGFSGAEVCSVCRRAALLAMQDNINTKNVKMCHFDKVLSEMKSGITPDMMNFFESFHNSRKLFM